MSKKFIALLLAGLLTLSLVACGSTTASNVDNSSAVSVSQDSTELPLDNVLSEITNAITDVTDAATEAVEVPTEEIPSATFEETVIVDNEYCTFTITSIDADNFWGYTLNAYIENKTDKNLMFSLDNVSVNGYMCDPFWASSVSAGMKSNEEISFSESDFEENGITDVTVIEFTLSVRDDDDWMADPIVDEVFSIYPLGTDFEAPTTSNENSATSEVIEETVIVDNEYCTFKITAVDENNMWGYTLKAYLENKTDKNLMFSLDNVSVNGYMCDPFWASTVAAGMKSNEEISFSEDDFELNGITSVTDIEFTLSVSDSDDWMADPIVDEVFFFYPQGEDAVVDYPRTAQADDIILFDDENCTMIVTGFDPNNIWGYTVKVFLENKTDKTLMFSIDNASVNGYMCDPFWASTVAAGKKCNAEVSWSESDFETNGITEVETLTLPITVYSYDDWASSDYINETYTVTP